MYYMYVSPYFACKHPNCGFDNGVWVYSIDSVYKFIDTARTVYDVTLDNIVVLKQMKINSQVSYRFE